MERKSEILRIKKNLKFRNGLSSVILAAVVFAVIHVVNMIVGVLPASHTVFDVTNEKLYSVGDTTKGVLAALEDTVTLYLITESGQEDEAVGKLAETYAASSDKVELVKVDAVASPGFTAQYTDETVPLNSVIAVCGDRSALASYASFYGYDYSYLSDTPTSWDAEGRITSAIARAAFDSSARVYYTVGHDELPLGAEMLDSLDKANIETAEINLLTETIPADCDALIVFAPGADFTPEETHKVSAYLGDGGRLLLVTMTEAVTGVSTPNLDSIPAEYGVGRKGGYVLEGDGAAYVQAPYLILPKVCVSEVTDGLGNLNIVCGLSEALDPGDTDGAAYTVTSVLASGDKSYRKENVGDTLEKEDGDENGPFVLALEVEQTLSMDDWGTPDVAVDEAGFPDHEDGAGIPDNSNNNNDDDDDDDDTEGDSSSGQHRATRIVYCATPCLFSASALSALIQQETALPEGNTKLFSNVMAYLTDSNLTVSVEPKSLAVPQTIISTAVQQTLGNVLMFAVPGVVLGVGVFVFVRRRRR